MTTLIFVRHGVTTANLNYVLMGRTDLSLHPLGHLQANEVASALATTPLDTIISSPLKRCMETAYRISHHQKNLPISVSDGLQEMDLGVVDGMSSFEAYSKYQSLMDEALNDTLPDFRFPSGESRSEALYRFEQAIHEIVSQNPEHTVCVVTHGGPLGLWLAKQHGELLGRFRAWQPYHASITRVTWEAGKFHIQTMDSRDHLSDEIENRVRQAFASIDSTK